MNDQRQVVFSQRKDIMQTEDVHDTILSMREETIEWIVSEAIPSGSFQICGMVNYLPHYRNLI